MDYEEVLGYYEIARSQFPGADVQSSSLEAFVEALMPYKSKLPVITKEFGDTWIQGSASDPRKVAEMRQCSEPGPNVYRVNPAALCRILDFTMPAFFS